MKKPLVIGIFCALGAVIIALGVYAASLDGRLERAGYAAAARGSAAAGELAGALAGLDEGLRAASYSADGAMRSYLCARAASDAAAAAAAMAALPGSTQELEALAGYINGAGDYALYLSRRAAAGEEPSAGEAETLKELSEAVSGISRDMGGAFAALDSGELRLDGYGEQPGEGTLGSALAGLDAALGDFPKLEYDGVYSARDAAPGLSGAGQVSEAAAREKASAFPGVGKLVSRGLTGGDAPCYCFEDGDTRVYVDGEQGRIMAVEAGEPSGELPVDAEERSLELVAELYGGEFTRVGAGATGSGLSFAPVEDGVQLLTDTVSVGFGGDGEICSVDASDYIMYNRERDLSPELTAQEAAGRLSAGLTPLGYRLALLRTDGGGEALCWSFLCSDGEGGRVTVSIDAKSGGEVKIEPYQS